MLLAINQLVEMKILGIASADGDVIAEISHSFATAFDPLYSTPNKIRAVAGSYIKDVSDEMLLYLIHIYSVEAEMISICAEANFAKWQYYASLWVTYKAALNAMYNAEFYIGNSGQKVYKKLGDFAISRDATGQNSSPADNLIKKLECEIFKLAVSVKFCKEPLIDCVKGVNSMDLHNQLVPQLAVKGELLSKPMFGRTFLRSGRHPQMTGFVKILDRHMLTNAQPGSAPSEPSDSRYR